MRPLSLLLLLSSPAACSTSGIYVDLDGGLSAGEVSFYAKEMVSGDTTTPVVVDVTTPAEIFPIWMGLDPGVYAVTCSLSVKLGAVYVSDLVIVPDLGGMTGDVICTCDPIDEAMTCAEMEDT